jgi:hypothetical protein
VVALWRLQPFEDAMTETVIAAVGWGVLYFVIPWTEYAAYWWRAPHYRIRVLEKALTQARAENARLKSEPLRLSFDPRIAPYYEEYPIQRVITTASGQQVPSGPASVKQVYRVCAHNDSAVTVENISVMLTRLDPSVQRYNDLPLHVMHDAGINGVYQQTFSLGPHDHQFIELFFKHSVDKDFKVCHALSHVSQDIASGAYRAFVTVKGRNTRPRPYAFNVRIESDRLFVDLMS